MYLYGCGGIAVVAIEVVEARGLAVEGFFDDAGTLERYQHRPVHPASALEEDGAFADAEILVCIGENYRRAELVTRLGRAPAAVAHPSCVISPTSTLGRGTMVFQGSVVQAQTTLGRGVIVNTRASVGHDVVAEDFVHIAPNTTTCGGVRIGEGANVGAGSVIIQNLVIGRWATIGAGAVVVRDVPDGAVVVGNPARVIRTVEPPPAASGA